MDCFGNLVPIPCAEIFGDHNAASHSGSHKKADHEKNKRPGRGYCRQCVGPKIFSHNQRICRIVKLLEYLA